MHLDSSSITQSSELEGKGNKRRGRTERERIDDGDCYSEEEGGERKGEEKDKQECNGKEKRSEAKIKN